MSENEAGPDRYVVVVNDEEQYSIWPEDKDVPAGWRTDGTAGSKEDCLRHVEEVWVDMRPLSLRRKMADRQATANG
jgi:MbtH protein